MDYHMMGGFRVVFVALLGCWFGVFFYLLLWFCSVMCSLFPAHSGRFLCLL